MKERASRISQKIAEIQLNISQNKCDNASKARKRLVGVENDFEHALTTNTQIFESLDQDMRKAINLLD